MPSSISSSRKKTFESCKLLYKYTYVTKFEPVDSTPDPVTNKGLVLHETFEKLLKYENYKDDSTPLTPSEFDQRKRADTTVVLSKFREAMEECKLPIKVAEEYNLKRGLKRWLSFKHDYLDPRNKTLYAEKRYDEILFDSTKTITILDLLEDNGDGTFNIYDYKTPKKANLSLYKEQLVLYAYMMAIIKGLIKPGATDYKLVAEKFKLFVFFPLLEDESETYEQCLKPLKFKEKDVQKVIEHLKEVCDQIDGFNWDVSAEALQPVKLGFQCNWCAFQGAKPQPDLIGADGKPFQGCPITAFCGMKQKSLFKVAETHH